jgi:hypothetical protein
MGKTERRLRDLIARMPSISMDFAGLEKRVMAERAAEKPEGEKTCMGVPIFVSYDEASSLKLDPKPGGVNRLGKGTQWWVPFTEETNDMNQFNINITALPQGGYTVGTPAPYRVAPTDANTFSPTFAGSLDECLDYIRAAYAKAETDKADADAKRAAQAARDEAIQALYDDANKKADAIRAASPVQDDGGF